MNKNIRGNRSNLILTNCYNVETGKIEFVEINLREPINKYIPEYIIDKLCEINEELVVSPKDMINCLKKVIKE